MDTRPRKREGKLGSLDVASGSGGDAVGVMPRCLGCGLVVSRRLHSPANHQVMSVVDASKPSYQLPGQSRLLVLKLHDGRTAAKAVEWRQGVGGLSEDTLPGTKVRVLHCAACPALAPFEPRPDACERQLQSAGWGELRASEPEEEGPGARQSG